MADNAINIYCIWCKDTHFEFSTSSPGLEELGKRLKYGFIPTKIISTNLKIGHGLCCQMQHSGIKQQLI